MKKIKLTKGKYALVDDENFDYLDQFTWYAIQGANTFYAVRYTNNNKYISMHRDILDAKKGQIVDHINRNGLDNRKHNLRFVTKSQNNINSQSRGTTSKYKGVCWDKEKKKWIAQIRYNKIHKFKRFDDEKLAAHVFDYWANELHQEYGYLNFPNSILKKKDYQNIVKKLETYSKYIGVNWHKNEKLWFAKIGIKNKSIHIGSFKTEIEAAYARNKYVIENNLNTKIYKLNEI